MPSKERRALAALHIAKPIRLRVRIYFLIFLVMAVIVVVDSIDIGGASVLPVLASLVAWSSGSSRAGCSR